MKRTEIFIQNYYLFSLYSHLARIMKKQPFKNFKSLDKMFELNKPYSITLNAEDQHTGYDDRIERMFKYYRKRLSKLHFEYHFSYEISTPLDGRTPRAHLHGVMYFSNYKQLLKWYEKDAEELARSMHVDIDTIQDMNEWSQYMNKNNEIMYHLIGDYTIKSIGYTNLEAAPPPPIDTKPKKGKPMPKK